MAGNGWIRSTLISMLATPSLLAPALAQDAKSVADNAALCHVALSLKAGEGTLAPADSVRYRRVADWFSSRGVADNSDEFQAQKAVYMAGFKASIKRGEADFPRAVNGCLSYYDSQNVE